MSKKLFSAMQDQLTPSPQARMALEEQLAQCSVRKRPAFCWKYGAAAACLLLAVAAFPILQHLNSSLHPVVQGYENTGSAYQENSALTTEKEDASSLPELNFWDTHAPSEHGSPSYAAGEGVNRDALPNDLNALLGGSVPEGLGWEDLSDLTGYLAFGPPKGAAETVQRPLDELFYAHFCARCSWGDLTLMVGGPSITVSPDVIGRPEDYPGDAITYIDGVEIRAARFHNPDGTAYGEVSFTLGNGYSIFYSVNTSAEELTEELLTRLVQAAVVENRLCPQALSPDCDAYDPTPSGTSDASAPAPLEGVSSWQRQPWFGGCYYDNAAGQYVIVTVRGEAVPELDFGNAVLTTGTYSYTHLSGLMDQLNELAITDTECGPAMAAWWLDEMENRICLTITEENPHLLAILAQLDPVGDAILVTVGTAPTTDAGEDIAS